MLDSIFHMCGYLPVDSFTHSLYDQDIVCHFLCLIVYNGYFCTHEEIVLLLSSLFYIIYLEEGYFISSRAVHGSCNPINPPIINPTQSIKTFYL
jgi:hypothetical protein